ncbi:MAG: hypothetical protein JWN33_676 [Candidatus Saccharibacteria bacterium]|nr:hypothetical protein [Candidatus Saccharibacteria bacterium]
MANSESLTEISPQRIALNKEREAFEARQAREREAFARRESLLEQETAFGKYDITAPNEGEETYASYLEKRPSDGVIRDGDGFRDVKSGNFASEEAYGAQKSSTEDYYHEQMNAQGAEAEKTQADYEAMGLVQLAKETAKAQLLGDKIEAEFIHDIAYNRVMEEATRPGGDDWTQEQVDQQMAQFDVDVEKFIRKQETGSFDARGTDAEATEGEVIDGAEVTDENEKQEIPTEFAEEIITGAEFELEQEMVATYSDGTRIEGTIDNLLIDPSGKRLYHLVDSNGNGFFANADELAPLEPETAPDEAAAVDVDPNDQIDLSGIETGVDEHVDQQEQTEDAEPKKSKFDRLKDFFRPSHIGAKWTTWTTKLSERSNNGLTDEEAEIRSKRLRLALGLGIAGGLLLQAINRDVMMSGGGSLFDWNFDLFDGGNGGGGEKGSGGHSSEPIHEGDGDTGQDNTPEAVDLPDFDENVTDGEGGYQLFEHSQLTDKQWDDVQFELLNEHNQDNEFYLMDDGNVGLTRQGPLSAGVQDFIKQRFNRD